MFIDLLDRNAAHDWIILNQLGRRNLSADWMSLLRGKIYNNSKSSHGGARKISEHFSGGKNYHLKNLDENINTSNSSGKNYHLKNLDENINTNNSSAKTAQMLADQYGVTEKTIRNDAKYAQAIDKICSEFGQVWRPKIVSSTLGKTQVIELAKHVDNEEYSLLIEDLLKEASRGEKVKADYRALMQRIKGTQFTKGQLVQVKFSNLQGLSQEERLSNGQYGLISEVDENSFRLQFFGKTTIRVKAEDIKPVSTATYPLNFSRDQFANLIEKFDSIEQLEAYIFKQISS